MATANVMHRPASPTTASSPCPSPCAWSAPGHHRDDDHERYCRHCPSRMPLRTDWAQGDVVCTQCGVVADERILDDMPEWRDFHDADDLAKGRPHQARSGMVPVDEALFVGGLQPTTLSRGLYMGSNFGNSGRGNGSSSASMASGIRKRLMAASRKIERRMEKASKEAIEVVRLNQQIQQRKRKRQRRDPSSPDYDDEQHDDNDEYSLGADSDPLLRPEYERLVLQEEEDTNRRKEALYADKWSLARAIRLCGSDREVSLLADDAIDRQDGGADNLDSTLKQASHDLYRVYLMIVRSTAALHVPDRVQGEAVELLCRYASRRDGLGVRGVSTSVVGGNAAAQPALIKKSPRQEREARAALTEYNKVKQAGALCSAVLFYSCRRMGHARPMETVCSSIRPPTSDCDNVHVKAELELNSTNHAAGGFITKKHCSKAMKEVKDLFPEVAVVNPAVVTPPTTSAPDPETNRVSTTLANLDAISNSVDHKIRTLHLPPVAQAMVRSLVLLLAFDELDALSGVGSATTGPLSSSKNLPFLCGAVTLLVCHAGAVMQRLAAQARAPHHQKQERRGSVSESTGTTPELLHYSDQADPPAAGSALLLLQNFEDDVGGSELHDGDALSSEQRAYEMGRIWDAWSSQTPWFRSVPHIEQSVRASGGTGTGSALACYRRHVFPRRHSLLRHVATAVTGSSNSEPVPPTTAEAAAPPPGTAQSLAEHVVTSTLRAAPLSSVLLPQLPLVAPMLNEDARTER